ncbi:hypothetical protein N0V84_006354 [Fusarium piperis]|uniref:Heterokaryon incompatibility domain-containing protein n=1 Tax=Fusarium piperis TaxID=1435070 RepID=A0A9W8WC22_9HYPO|nr:hypothetical protein N0V84_006354 [Fusarium piperis]
MKSPIQGLCDACAAVGLTREDFENPPFLPEEKYHQVVRSGTLNDLRLNETNCGLCKLLLYALSRTSGSQLQVLEDSDAVWEAEWMQNTWEYDSITDNSDDLFGSAIYPKLKGDGQMSYGVQLLDEAMVDRPLRARVVPSQMDTAKMKTWIQKCQAEHGDSCSDSYLTMGSHPSALLGFMVINVVTKCLTEPPPQAKYVALSYVWGSTNFPLTTKSNLEDFRKEGAFDRVKLAKTIRHAIEVTACLGFDFLWVDALCIVQDDERYKPQLIANMDAVYGNAALTILAASGGHADAGLSGWASDGIPDRENAILDVRIAPDLHLTVRPLFDIELMDASHSKRGWT